MGVTARIQAKAIRADLEEVLRRNTQTLMIHKEALALIEKAMEAYPEGHRERRTSGAYSQTTLADLAEVGRKSLRRAQDNLTQTTRFLEGLQEDSDGRISMTTRDMGDHQQMLNHSHENRGSAAEYLEAVKEQIREAAERETPQPKPSSPEVDSEPVTRRPRTNGKATRAPRADEVPAEPPTQGTVSSEPSDGA